jgi:hypothetical protein
MGFKLFASRSDRIRFIPSCDDAVVLDTPEQKAAYRQYLETLDEGLLTLRGQPVVFLLRPLDLEVYEIALRNAKGAALKGIFIDPPAARELVRLSVEEIENWPAEWGGQDKAFHFEHRRRVLSPRFSPMLPPGLCAEAAHVLLDSLPVPDVELPPAAAPKEGSPPPFPPASGASSGS